MRTRVKFRGDLRDEDGKAMFDVLVRARTIRYTCAVPDDSAGHAGRRSQKLDTGLAPN